MPNFALTGAAGYIAPRHLQAIRDTGNSLLSAVDPHDSVGILDQYFPNASFFTEIERFDRHIEKLRRGPEEGRIHFISICSPNHLHDAHIRLTLRVGASAICEKPLVMNPWNLDALQELENESDGTVNTVLQLRVHPSIIELKESLSTKASTRHRVNLQYITSRGKWYRYSWKGHEPKSGGVATNIGIHFFDLLIWLFGPVQNTEVHVSSADRIGGILELQNADVNWFLSILEEDLPELVRDKQRTYRSISIDGNELEFSGGFSDLHTRVYEETLAGRGFCIEDARPSIELVYALRHAPVVSR